MKVHLFDIAIILTSSIVSDELQALKWMTLEVLFIKDVKPSINTKDEFRSRALTIKI